MNFQTWYDQTLGKPIDVDGAFGDQCVDVAMSWAQFCFPGHKWPELLGYGDAKDLFNASNANYFEKLSPQTAHQGDLVVFGATSTNPYGHIAVVVNGYADSMNVIEQNGFNPSGVAYLAQRPYNNVIGLLRPKGLDMSKEALTKAEVELIYMEAYRVPQTQVNPDVVKAFTGKTLQELIQFIWKDATFQKLFNQGNSASGLLSKIKSLLGGS